MPDRTCPNCGRPVDGDAVRILPDFPERGIIGRFICSPCGLNMRLNAVRPPAGALSRETLDRMRETVDFARGLIQSEVDAGARVHLEVTPKEAIEIYAALSGAGDKVLARGVIIGEAMMGQWEIATSEINADSIEPPIGQRVKIVEET